MDSAMDISNEQKIIVDLSVSLYEDYHMTHFSEFMYSLWLIVCPFTLDTMNSYKIIFNVIAIGFQK